jgi:AcrR family transcriptional regulator
MTVGPSTTLTPRAREIVGAARELLETEGAAGLSMRRIAERLGIRAPSLYKHFRDKEALAAAIVSDGFEQWARRFGTAVAQGPDPLAALARAYRDFALEHPHLYRLMTEGPLARDRLAPGVEERAAASLLEAASGDADLARAIWAFAHGMAILELDGRFPPGADLDSAWQTGMGAFRRHASV